jgi:hypothetical protein
MPSWKWPVLAAFLLVVVGALYVRLLWRSAPQAYRAMIAAAVCYFVAGSLLGAWVFRLTEPRAPAGPAALASPLALPAPIPSFALSPFDIGSLHYDPAHAVLPDRSLTPGDVLPDATKDDVCTPGWSREHREVTESMRDRVYAEYGRTRGPGCCEVDHLIPLELGGSNDMKNLWPQPDDPRPGSPEKDQLENELHSQVCSGKMPLADASSASRRTGLNAGISTSRRDMRDMELGQKRRRDVPAPLGRCPGCE